MRALLLTVFAVGFVGTLQAEPLAKVSGVDACTAARRQWPRRIRLPRQAPFALQAVLDPLCLVGVNINPESRVSVVRGAAKAALNEQGWSVFLIKVHNEAGVTAPLRRQQPQRVAAA